MSHHRGVFSENPVDSDYASRLVAIRIAGDIIYSRDFGEALRKWREYFEVSQSEIAREMGVTASVISDYEKSRRTPGAVFIKRFVDSLISIDAKRGWKKTKDLAMLAGTVPGAIVDMREFEKPLTVGELSSVVEGVILGFKDSARSVYGYTLVDSVKAILSLSGLQFTVLFGLNPQRAIVFTKSTTGRSPMVAVRTSPLKPAVVIVHGPGRNVDRLAIEIAKADRVPLVVSQLDSEEELASRLRSLTMQRRFTPHP
ncbi:putative HTH-type transcriptional regulator [Aeropyrum pernix]|uniref:Putative HTH-type transcriptional regulator n=1 Tax=Aeropyrum pernix TaxID=56636 RepID=A0A401HB68_AERPX|nr:helix-turn-helix domain-containing protein [Aeropyrum pernix]GBF09559.1 putative HTH-type transcriptional regulator [Aeropyrum pernix]